MDSRSVGSFTIMCRLGAALQAQPFKAKRAGILSSFFSKYSTERRDVAALLQLLLGEGDEEGRSCRPGDVDAVAAFIARLCGVSRLGELEFATSGTLTIEDALAFVQQMRKIAVVSKGVNGGEVTSAPSVLASRELASALSVARKCTPKDFESLLCIVAGCYSAVCGLTTMEEALDAISPASATEFRLHHDLDGSLDVACAGSPRAAIERDPTVDVAELDGSPFDADAPAAVLLDRASSLLIGPTTTAAAAAPAIPIAMTREVGSFTFRAEKPLGISPPSSADADGGAAPRPSKRGREGVTEATGGRKPMCRYGASCRRKNPAHFREYEHPPAVPDGSALTLTPPAAPAPAPPAAAHAARPPAPAPTSRPPADLSALAVNGIKPLRAMPEHEHIFVDGVSSTYKMKNCGGNVYTCNCPVWRYQTRGANERTCKHLQQYLGEEFEAARCGLSTPAPASGGGRLAPETASTASSEPTVAGKRYPIPGVLLANKADPAKSYDGWLCSEKLDGVRAFWDGARLLSRNGNVFTAPDWFIAALPKDRTLDGELFGGRKKFQATVSVVKSSPNHPGWATLTYEIFDIPSAGSSPFEARLKLMEDLFPAERRPRHVHVVEHEACRGREYLVTRLQAVDDLGGEGLMLREPGSRYVHSRSNTLLKLKSTEHADAVVIGHDTGKGKYTGRTGALHCQLENGKQFFVGSGLTDAQRTTPPPVGTVITVRYQELTDGGVPRFPVFCGCRYDVDWPPRSS